MTPVIIYCTCPDIETARKISRLLISQHMAACINQVPGITSIYEWEGKIEENNEVLLLIKSTEERFDAIQRLVIEEHSYELPELIAVPVSKGLPDYLDWIKECTK
ncbi:MAG: divalent-cation tolerance protein CutA [Gammaproteobacteria bacterium]|nr:divalent-cation tolerance protein CutA [Gammaproteobacteria bacterium]